MQRPLPNTKHSQETDLHSPGGFRTHNPRKRAAADPRLKEKSERTDENKTFLLSFVPRFKKTERWPEVLGKDGNSGHYEESQNYGVAATVSAAFYRNLFLPQTYDYNLQYQNTSSIKCSK